MSAKRVSKKRSVIEVRLGTHREEDESLGQAAIEWLLGD